MAGDASPTPGFLMLVQYVATLCHLHSIAIVQLQFKLHNQQTLEISNDCCGITQLLSRWGRELQIAQHKLVENELMIHHMVDETVPYVIKSDLNVFGSVEGAGVGWSFLKLQHIGSGLQAVPLTMLPHYWSCAQQVQHQYNILHACVGGLQMEWLLLCHLQRHFRV